MATQQLVFYVVLMVFSDCMVFTMVSEMYGWQKRANIDMYVCMCMYENHSKRRAKWLIHTN